MFDCYSFAGKFRIGSPCDRLPSVDGLADRGRSRRSDRAGRRLHESGSRLQQARHAHVADNDEQRGCQCV